MALPAAIAAPAAYAANSVTNVVTQDDGRLAVVGLPTNALWVKVSVLASGAEGADVLAATDAFSLSGASAWTTDAPIKLPEGTTLGDYPVRVQYRLPGGLVTTQTIGAYGYKLHTGLSSVAFDRKTTSYDARTVVLSGRATTWNPATGERTDAAPGTSVKVSLKVKDAFGLERTQAVTATTEADGAFTLPVTPDAEILSGTAEVVGSADVDPDDARPLPAVGVEKLTYRITSDTSRFRVNAGTDVTVTGRVERLTEDGWKPFGEGAPVITTGTAPVSYESSVRNQIGGGSTRADGSFSYQARAQTTTTGAYTGLRPSVYYGNGNNRPYDEVPLAVPQQFNFVNTAHTMDQFGAVTVRGTLGASSTCYTKRDWVALQVSFDNGRTWGQVKALPVNDWCGYEFKIWGYENALYRVYHPETDRFVTKTSNPVRLSRIPTRIVNLSVTPSRPTTGGSMTVKGLVQQKVNGVWKAMPGARVTFVFLPKGSKPNEGPWYLNKKDIATSSSGTVSFRTTNWGDGSWGLFLQEKNGYFYSQSRALYVDAR
ncbi:hypothetical protein [Streptomyces sp. NPDC090025]|uniref:hypothetical protein n=1 Tax=Streptomyces sp. NPDC090025 TaxID=3365922 RepID=UPI003835B587